MGSKSWSFPEIVEISDDENEPMNEVKSEVNNDVVNQNKPKDINTGESTEESAGAKQEPQAGAQVPGSVRAHRHSLVTPLRTGDHSPSVHLTKVCAESQGQLIWQAMDDDQHLRDVELVILDTLRALALSHQRSEVQMHMRDSEFEEHQCTKPTTIETGPKGPTSEVVKYDCDSHGKYSASLEHPEGDALSSIMKHVFLTCEANVHDIYYCHVIAAVLCLLTLVIADLAPTREFINTFDDEKFEEAWGRLCKVLKEHCSGYHPFWRPEKGMSPFEQENPELKLYGVLFEDLKGIWNGGGFCKEYEDEPLSTKLRSVAFGEAGL
ncbi:hypothetical protein IFR05_005088 [Cadophora sp. M221]|nr:hypothetical protein IFR05_005088 [Cadophora sp. M221]